MLIGLMNSRVLFLKKEKKNNKIFAPHFKKDCVEIGKETTDFVCHDEENFSFSSNKKEKVVDDLASTVAKLYNRLDFKSAV